MREILFRAKEKETGVWVEGDLVRDLDCFGENKTCIYQITGKGCWRKYFVDPETVCQYTRLTDKNGLQKIFECDIISENGERIGNVYEKENIQPGTSYITITRMGTKEWEDTKQERDRCGLRYA